MRDRIKTIALWLLLPVGLLLAGVATYLSGALEPPAPKTSQAARLEFTTAELPLSVTSRTLLSLEWGDGEDEAALMSYDGEFEISTIEAVIPEPDGSFLVVDHPGWHRGARVRRYSEKGAQTGRWLTPAGSTLFASDGARLAYIVSKQADESERLVLVDDTAEKTFVVPLNINSGGIVFIGSDVWIRTTSSVFDQASRKVTATEIVVPVVVDGKQVGDEAAKEAVREGWFAAGAELYERSRVVEGQGDAAVITQTLVRSSNGTRLEVPGRSVPLGVDADGAAFVLIEAETLDSRLSRLAAYPAAFGRTERVLVAGFDGAVRGMIVLPASPLSRQAPGRVALAPDGDLYAVRSGSDGASVVEYSVVPR